MGLFDLVVPEQRCGSSFLNVLNSPLHAGTRRVMEDAFADFEDSDGNFLEQFQTAGFDPRFFELYLHATFKEQGFTITRPKANPDFLISREGLTLAIEATTTAPTMSVAGKEPTGLAKDGRTLEGLDIQGRRDYAENEFPIRLGSALTSKLKKKYWESADCRGIPFVLAIQAFHDPRALEMSDYGLSRYLYGEDFVSPEFRNGILHADMTDVPGFTVGSKTVGEAFFDLPDARNVSAVLFTNQGTLPKFTRIAAQQGLTSSDTFHVRIGAAHDDEPSAIDPMLFAYDLRRAPFRELFGSGLCVYHNPNAVVRLPNDVFKGALEVRFTNRFMRSIPLVHIYSSTTATSNIGASEFPVGRPSFVTTIPPSEVPSVDLYPPDPSFSQERWFQNLGGHQGCLLVCDQGWTFGLLWTIDGVDRVVRDDRHRPSERDSARVALQRALLMQDTGQTSVRAGLVLAGIAHSNRKG